MTKSDLLLSLEFCKILDTKTDRLTAGESSQFLWLTPLVNLKDRNETLLAFRGCRSDTSVRHDSSTNSPAGSDEGQDGQEGLG
jgi:hypothetical protein